jgi:hypothetical protein
MPENVARRFASGHIFGIGRTVREFLRAYKGAYPHTLPAPTRPETR